MTIVFTVPQIGVLYTTFIFLIMTKQYKNKTYFLFSINQHLYRGNSPQFYACLIQAPRRWGTADVPKWSHRTRPRTRTYRARVLNMHYASC